MSSRDDILIAVHNHGPTVAQLPQLPDFSNTPADLVDLFTAALARLDGKVIPDPPADLQASLATVFPDARRICSAASEISGNVDPTGFEDWAAPADVDVTVMRTPLGVAETGVHLGQRERDLRAHCCGARTTSARAARSHRHRREHPLCISAPRLPRRRLRGSVVGTIRLR
jgi:hypothetical protein